jgi:hypothetical protein
LEEVSLEASDRLGDIAFPFMGAGDPVTDFGATKVPVDVVGIDAPEKLGTVAKGNHIIELRAIAPRSHAFSNIGFLISKRSNEGEPREERLQVRSILIDEVEKSFCHGEALAAENKPISVNGLRKGGGSEGFDPLV